MHLFRYAKGSEWTVYLYCKSKDECQVLDLLLTSGDVGARMLADLKKVSTRPHISLVRDQEFSKSLGGKLLEFRLNTSRGPTPRVAYFFDKGQVIICAVALMKKSQKSPQSFIDEAEEIRKTYVKAGGVENADVEDYIEEDDDKEEEQGP